MFKRKQAATGLEQIIASKEKDNESLIVLPPNAVSDAFIDFGLAEITSMFVDVTATQTADWMMTTAMREKVLWWWGPVVEKAGFFLWPYAKLLYTNKKKPKSERQPIIQQYKQVIKDGMPNLIKDILLHDPVYCGIMYTCLKKYPDTDAWVLSLSAFVIGVVFAGFATIAYDESKYAILKRKLGKIGFGKETYFESRFKIEKGENPKKLIEVLVKEFGLNSPEVIKYQDRYIAHTLPEYSKRTAKLRIRNRQLTPQEKESLNPIFGLDQENAQSLQIIYKKASEHRTGNIDQYRFFVQKKEKLYFPLNQTMPSSIAEIENMQVRKLLAGFEYKDHDGKAHIADIEFNRTVAHNQELLVATDTLKETDDRSFYIVELKTRTNLNLLQEAMRYVMKNFKVEQTTHGKYGLLYGNGFS